MTMLKTVYIMAFAPSKLQDSSLVEMCRASSAMLSAKDENFNRKMGLMDRSTRMTFSNQLYSPIMHTPQVMMSTLGGWLKNENAPFDPKTGENFFVHGLKDANGAENFVMYYFELAE